MTTVLSAEDVSVSFGGQRAAAGVSFTLAAGEVLAVVGESGSGKSVTALSLLGLLPGTATVTGKALLRGTDLYGLPPAELRAIRGNEIAMVFQEPMTALNPVFTIGNQLAEALRVHQKDLRNPKARALELLELTGLPDPARAYPHELSGGQLQRVVIAMAIANDPAVLIADEPTTALDVTVQAEILSLLRELRDRHGCAILLITHDMGVVADLADRVLVMRDGEVVESGGVEQVFASPAHPYTRQLLSSVITLGGTVSPAAAKVAEPVVQVKNLSQVYRGGVRALADASFSIAAGEVLGLVGESGSGKSTVAGIVTGLLRPTSGEVSILGTNPARLRGAARRELARQIGVVFQDPVSSLNPRATAGTSIAEPIRLHKALTGSAVDDRVAELLESVQLPASFATRYPHELSGGQRQRVGLARALALRPRLLVADEPTSALDVSVQAKVLDLFRELQDSLGFACLFISHDLAVVERLADRVAVMQSGHIVEQGPAAQVLNSPAHPYTQRLIAAVPVADPVEQRERRLKHAA
ncbi:ABC transporter ATP-binding protein [Longispora albida]|uniref:ABC transporter ATP-binding protein n=1 Tax=Longispora albida TaxID=203523 RepID=UPI00037E0009|nr:ABC transporter ATP-binding protein [Longispora albida]